MKRCDRRPLLSPAWREKCLPQMWCVFPFRLFRGAGRLALAITFGFDNSPDRQQIHSMSALRADIELRNPGRVVGVSFVHQACCRDRGLFWRVRTNEFAAARTVAADLDHRGFAYLYVMGDVCRLGIKTSRRQFLEVGGLYLVSIAGVPGPSQDSDL